MPSKKKQEEQPITESVKSAELGTNGVDPSHIKCIMIGIAMILFMNLVMTIVAVVLGLQVKSEVDAIHEELSPMIEMMNSINIGAGVGGNGGPTLP